MEKLDELNVWDGLTLGPFTGGINTYKRADSIGKNELVKLTNLRLEKDQVVIDTGYSTFGVAIRGKPQLFHDFISRDGSRRPMLITTDTVYRYIYNEWQYIAGDANTNTTAVAVAGSTTVVVTSTTGFVDNAYIGIILDNGVQHQTQVNGSPVGSTITFDDAIPAGRTVELHADIISAVILKGVESVHVRFDVYAAYDWFMFTNNIDPPKRYDTNNCIDIPNLPKDGDIVCRDIKVFINHVLLLGTTEGGISYPQRVRRSDTGDPLEWILGNAGYEDLLDDAYVIMGAESLGPYLIIYKNKSIVRYSYVGSSFRTFYAETMVSDEGAVSGAAFVKADDRHVFMGNENIYVYMGGMDLQKIGDKISYNVMGEGGDLSPNYQQTTLAIYVKNLKEVWFAYPSGSNTNPDKVIRIRIDSGAWVSRVFNNIITGWGTYITSDDKAWGELVGSWDVQTWRWGAQALTQGSEHIMLCGADKQVYRYDYSSTDDNGDGIAYTLETREIYHERLHTRVDMISFSIRSSTLVTIEYSEDKGVTWAAYGTTTPGTAFKTVEIYKQIIAKRLRFRLTGIGGNFGLEWIYIKSSTEGEW